MNEVVLDGRNKFQEVLFRSKDTNHERNNYNRIVSNINSTESERNETEMATSNNTVKITPELAGKVKEIVQADSSNRVKFGKLSDLGYSVAEIRDIMNSPLGNRAGGKISYSQVYIGIATRSDVPKNARKYQNSTKREKVVCNCTEVVCICKDRSKVECNCWEVRKGDAIKCNLHG